MIRNRRLFWSTIEGGLVGIAVHYGCYGLASFLFTACILCYLYAITNEEKL